MNACTDRFYQSLPGEDRIVRRVMIDPETSYAKVILALDVDAVVDTYPHHHESIVSGRTVRPYDGDESACWDDLPTVDLMHLLSPATQALITAEVMAALAAGRLDDELIDSTD